MMKFPRGAPEILCLQGWEEYQASVTLDDQILLTLFFYFSEHV